METGGSGIEFLTDDSGFLQGFDDELRTIDCFVPVCAESVRFSEMGFGVRNERVGSHFDFGRTRGGILEGFLNRSGGGARNARPRFGLGGRSRKIHSSHRPYGGGDDLGVLSVLSHEVAPSVTEFGRIGEAVALFVDEKSPIVGSKRLHGEIPGAYALFDDGLPLAFAKFRHGGAGRGIRSRGSRSKRLGNGGNVRGGVVRRRGSGGGDARSCGDANDTGNAAGVIGDFGKNPHLGGYGSVLRSGRDASGNVGKTCGSTHTVNSVSDRDGFLMRRICIGLWFLIFG